MPHPRGLFPHSHRDVRFSHPPGPQHFPASASRQDLLGRCLARAHGIRYALVVTQAVGQDLRRRVDESHLVELHRTLAVIQKGLSGAETRRFLVHEFSTENCTDTPYEGTIPETVIKRVINGVWEWACPRYAVWLLVCYWCCSRSRCSRQSLTPLCSIPAGMRG